MYQRFGTLLRCECETFGDAEAERNQAAGTIAKTSGDEARMPTVRGYSRAGKLPGKFASEQDVAELRTAVHLETGATEPLSLIHI